jgi:hypothetical protein
MSIMHRKVSIPLLEMTAGKKYYRYWVLKNMNVIFARSGGLYREGKSILAIEEANV